MYEQAKQDTLVAGQQQHHQDHHLVKPETPRSVPFVPSRSWKKFEARQGFVSAGDRDRFSAGEGWQVDAQATAVSG